MGTSGVSPEMALRLAKTLGRSPESWLDLQDGHDLGQARRRVDLANGFRSSSRRPERGS